jgi:hypothetical protein
MCACTHALGSGTAEDVCERVRVTHDQAPVTNLFEPSSVSCAVLDLEAHQACRRVHLLLSQQPGGTLRVSLWHVLQQA